MESPSEGGSGEFRVTAAATLLASFATLPLFLTGGLAVLMRADLGFGIGAIGVAGAIFVASSAASSVPGGKLTERIGPRRALLGFKGSLQHRLVDWSVEARRGLRRVFSS